MHKSTPKKALKRLFCQYLSHSIKNIKNNMTHAKVYAKVLIFLTKSKNQHFLKGDIEQSQLIINTQYKGNTIHHLTAARHHFLY